MQELSFKNKKYPSLKSLYEEYKEQSPISYTTFVNRFNEGLSTEEALFTPRKYGSSSGYIVEGINYKTIPDIARAYNLSKNSIYKRYSRGKLGDDLVPFKKRRNYSPPKKTPEKYKIVIDGKGFHSFIEACRHYRVKYVTFNHRRRRGLTIREALGLDEVFDKRKLDRKKKIRKKSPARYVVRGKIYDSASKLAEAYNLPKYVVSQRINQYGFSPYEAVTMEGKSKQVIIKGKKYKSRAAAAREYGKSSHNVNAAIKRGLTIEEALGISSPKTKNTIYFRGNEYKNRTSLAKAFDISLGKLNSRLKRGFSLDEALSMEKIIKNKGRYNQTILDRDIKLASKKAWIYFVSIRIKDENLYKIGITTRSVSERLSGIHYQELISFQDTLIKCFNLEQIILEQYQNNKIETIQGEHLDGYSEVLNLTAKEAIKIKKLLNNHMKSKTTKTKAVLSDLDGTISDRRHRLHHIEDKKDWDSFFDNLIYDPPILNTIKKIDNLLTENTKLIFVTGRPERYRLLSQEWIEKNTPFRNFILLMRDNKDYRKDQIIKQEMLKNIKQNYSVDTVFEDQPDLAEMWAAEGLNCIMTLNE